MKPTITYTLECLPEDINIKGNCSAIDEETDRETEQWIIRELRAGNEWAWCCAKVTCTIEFNGHTFVGQDVLGCCSYKSKEDFKQSCYEDMKAEAYLSALLDIKQTIKHAEVARHLLTVLEAHDESRAVNG